MIIVWSLSYLAAFLLGIEFYRILLAKKYNRYLDRGMDHLGALLKPKAETPAEKTGTSILDYSSEKKE